MVSPADSSFWMRRFRDSPSVDPIYSCENKRFCPDFSRVRIYIFIYKIVFFFRGSIYQAHVDRSCVHIFTCDLGTKIPSIDQLTCTSGFAKLNGKLNPPQRYMRWDTHHWFRYVSFLLWQSRKQWLIRPVKESEKVT